MLKIIVEAKIAKFEAGDFKNQFFPCYLANLDTVSTRREGLKTD
jgi:hypothetical protein